MISNFITHFKLPEYWNIDMLQFILRQILSDVYTIYFQYAYCQRTYEIIPINSALSAFLTKYGARRQLREIFLQLSVCLIEMDRQSIAITGVYK